MAVAVPGTPAWLGQVKEEIVEPERRIVDPHHHLWNQPDRGSYLLEDLWADTGSGHGIEKTVFVECRASYRDAGPEHLRPVGETEFVAEIAAASAAGGSAGAAIAGIVAHADLTRGDAVEEVLHAHEQAGRGLFRGIRHAGARDPHPEELMIAGLAPEALGAPSRERRRAEARGVIAHIARQSGAASLAACAARFGRDAATLSHAAARIERRTTTDPAFAERLDALNNAIMQA